MNAHNLFNESERELLDAARCVLHDGLRRLTARQSLLPATGRRADDAACREARQALADALVSDYGSLRHEVAIAVLIDPQGRLIAIEQFPLGRATSCEMRPRILAGFILKHEAAAVLLAHNHPSGISTPSKADITFTDNIVKWLKPMECQLLDHLVLSAADWCSITGEW